MSIYEKFLSLLYQRIHRTHKRRDNAGSSFHFREVKTVDLSKDEAEKQATELVNLLLFIHRNTNFSVCKADDALLKLIHMMLTEHKGEEEDIQQKKYHLHMKYAEELHDRIMEYIEWHEDTYINFKEASEVLKRADCIMEGTQVNASDIGELSGK